MSELWQDEGFGSTGAVSELDGDDWDEGDESLDTSLEDAFGDPDGLADDSWADEDDA